MIFRNTKILLTIFHDFIILCISFFLALWLRLENQSYNLIQFLWPYMILFATLNFFLLSRFGLYHGIWRYASIQEISSITKSLFASTLFILAALFLSIRLENIPRSFPLLLFFVSFFAVASPRFIYRILKDKISVSKGFDKVPVIVVGEGDSAELFIRAANREKNSPFRVVAILGSKKKSVGRSIHSIPIISTINSLDNLKNILLKKKLKPQRIIIADHSLDSAQVENLFIFSKINGLAIGKLPQITDFKEDTLDKFSTKPIVFEDILGRSQKTHDINKLIEIQDKVILVTGAGGSIGSELSRQILNFKPKKLIIYEQNEYNLYKVLEGLKSKNIISILGDVKNKNKMENTIKKYKPQIVFHAAALKHITFVENDPLEALKNNFLSTVELSNICERNRVSKMIFISTDKAVNPSNVMGASKRLCEKYIQMISKNSKTNFKIIRFGNVLGSTGSVIPLFEKQIQKGGPITITHPKVSRFFMTIREAVELVLISSVIKSEKNGSINILEMGEPVKIIDLAEKMIKLIATDKKGKIEIKFTKLRKGEKIHEELFYKKEEIKKTSENGILETNTLLFPLIKKDVDKLITTIKNNLTKDSIILLKKNLPEYLVE